jgi:LmbE family N-acetylglucosaminyl deacetylase
VNLLLAPHNDDEALFAAYTLLRECPLVLTCLDGRRKKDFPLPADRVAESMAAMEILGCEYDHLWVPLAYEDWQASVERRLQLRNLDPDVVWAPFPEPGGHEHHNQIAELATRMWPGSVRFYSTYTQDAERVVHRSTEGVKVPVEPGWEDLKLRALACYRTQSERDGTAMHFDAPLVEYEVPTLRLNLGGEINRLPGYVNMDVSYGWKFEDGLGMWGDASVEAISVSHVLMYVRPEHWPLVFEEIARVLQPGGILRITEDAIGAPGSTRPVIRPRAHVATCADIVLKHMQNAGLAAGQVAQDTTLFADETLIQRNYGAEPDVFHAEGVKVAA